MKIKTYPLIFSLLVLFILGLNYFILGFGFVHESLNIFFVFALLIIMLINAFRKHNKMKDILSFLNMIVSILAIIFCIFLNLLIGIFKYEYVDSVILDNGENISILSNGDMEYLFMQEDTYMGIIVRAKCLRSFAVFPSIRWEKYGKDTLAFYVGEDMYTVSTNDQFFYNGCPYFE